VNKALPYALAAVLAFAGCGTDSGASSSASPPAAGAPTEAASTPSAAAKTPMSRRAGAAYYLAAVKSYNAVYGPCAVIEQNTDLTDAELRRALAACRRLPGAVTALVHRLQHPPTPWPAEARGPIGDMVEYLQVFRYCVKDLRTARTVDGFWAVAAKSCPDDLGVSNLVRAHLGLPAASG
jgi:hypothetical protein